MNKNLINAYLQDLLLIKEDIDEKNHETIEECGDAVEDTNDVDDLTEENTTTISEDSEDSEDSTECSEEKDEAMVDDVATEDDEEDVEEMESNDSVVEDSEDEIHSDETGDEDDDEDGWNEEIVEGCSSIMESFDNFVYELKNCVKGSFTGCKTREELKTWLNDLAEEIVEVSNNL